MYDIVYFDAMSSFNTIEPFSKLWKKIYIFHKLQLHLLRGDVELMNSTLMNSFRMLCFRSGQLSCTLRLHDCLYFCFLCLFSSSIVFRLFLFLFELSESFCPPDVQWMCFSHFYFQYAYFCPQT